MANPLGRPPVNRYKVPVRSWNRWGRAGQRTFNKTYDLIRRNQPGFMHPKATLLPREQWNTVAWNAAWTAAEVAAGRA